MLLVAARVVKVHLAVLNNGVVPIGHVNSPVGTNRNIHRTKRYVIGRKQVFYLLGSVATALFFEFKTVDAVGAEIVGNHTSLPRIGQMPTRNDV